MERYKTLLCLGISLSLLSGCQVYDDYFAKAPSETTTALNSTAPPSTNVNNSMHLTPSSATMDLINKNDILDAIHTQRFMLDYVIESCEKSSVPTDIALIPLLTSLYDNQSKTADKAGIWQLTPQQAQNLSLTNGYWFDARLDVVGSTDAVIAYMKFLHAKLDYDWTLALTAYHTGLQPALDALNYNKTNNLPTHLDALNLEPEDKQFVAKLSAVSHLLATLPKNTENKLMSVAFPGQIDLVSLADVANLNLNDLKNINGGFKRHLTDPDGPHRILVRAEDYKQLKSITKDATRLRRISKSNWNHHAVAPNESLSVIAKRYGSSISEIKRVNHLTSDIIIVGQKLLIPETQPKATTKPQATLQGSGPRRILHQVQKSETLYHLSKQYHVDIEDIAYWNNLDKPAIQPNQTVTIWQYIPTDTAKFYTVKRNDSLAKIARAHQVSIIALKEANQLTETVIHPNDRLVIPTKTTGKLQNKPPASS